MRQNKTKGLPRKVSWSNLGALLTPSGVDPTSGKTKQKASPGRPHIAAWGGPFNPSGVDHTQGKTIPKGISGGSYEATSKEGVVGVRRAYMRQNMTKRHPQGGLMEQLGRTI